MFGKDPEYNRPGMKGYHARTPKKSKKDDEEASSYHLTPHFN